jgi:hypothetical protein
MRKAVVILNALLKTGATWDPKRHAPPAAATGHAGTRQAA